MKQAAGCGNAPAGEPEAGTSGPGGRSQGPGAARCRPQGPQSVGANRREAQQVAQVLTGYLEMRVEEVTELPPGRKLVGELVQLSPLLPGESIGELLGHLLEGCQVNPQLRRTSPEPVAHYLLTVFFKEHTLVQTQQILAAHHRPLMTAAIAARAAHAVNDTLKSCRGCPNLLP